MLRNQSIFTSHEDNTTPSKTQQGRFSVSARRSSTAASRADPEAADAGRLARPATLCINAQRSSLYRAMIWPAATCAVRCMIGLAVAPRMRTSQGAQRSGSSPLTEARSSTCDTLGRWIGRWTVAVADSRSSSIGGKDFEPRNKRIRCQFHFHTNKRKFEKPTPPLGVSAMVPWSMVGRGSESRKWCDCRERSSGRGPQHVVPRVPTRREKETFFRPT